jgi:hypothetical protein
MKNNYSLYNCYDAEFGLGKYFANKATKDIKEVMGSGATQEVIDDVVKRAIDSGEKQVTQKAQRFGKKVRRLWKASPKLRRNVKIAGVAGAGLVGLNALTGLKTVYDIGTGVKNKLKGKKREYSMFLTDVASFAQNVNEVPKQEKSELRRWGGAARNSALVGGGIGLAALTNPKYIDRLKELKVRKIPAVLSSAGWYGTAGLGGYAAYRGGKALINKLRGKKKETKNAQYSLFNPYVVEFAQNTTEQPKKKSLLKKAIKYGAIGGVGLAGLAGAKRYGGAALKYHLANRKYNNYMNSPKKSMSMKDMQDFGNAYKTVFRGGAKGQVQRDVNRLRGRSPVVTDVRTGFVNID